MRTLPLATLLLASASLGACSTWKPPAITYDDTPRQAVLQPDPPKPVQVVELPKLLPLPGQLKPIPGARTAARDAADPHARVDQANGAARVEPTRAGYINAIQVYPYSDGALYQVYAAPGEITDIALEPGEQLVGSGPVAAGDTVRWIIGDTRAGTARPSASISCSSRPGRTSSPTSSSTPTAGPITSSCARPTRPIWRRCRGFMPKTSSSRCASRTPPPMRRRPSRPASTSTRSTSATDRGRQSGLAAAAGLR